MNCCKYCGHEFSENFIKLLISINLACPECGKTQREEDKNQNLQRVIEYKNNDDEEIEIGELSDDNDLSDLIDLENYNKR